MAVIYIIILIGVLVFVHEFGHYLAARIFNVKVTNFSIGFGPKLCGFKRKDTEWEIRILPLGGFVQMYGNELEEINDKDDPDFDRAYNNKPIWQKAIINFAGPLFNLLLPIPILFAVYMGTVTTDLPPQVGQVLDNSPAIGILEPGDVITHIDGEEIKYWTTLHNIIADNPDQELKFTVLRDGQTIDLSITPKSTTLRDNMDVMTETVGRIGITPDAAPPIIGLTSTQKPAATHGLQTFDEITAINGQPSKTFVELEHAIRHNNAETLQLTVLRSQKLDIDYGTVNVLNPIQINIPSKITSIEQLGIASANMYLSEVDPNSPAAKAGLQKGDRILTVDGKSVNVFRSFLDKLVQDWENPHQITLLRGDNIISTTIQLEKITITGEFQEEYPMIYAGFYHKPPIVSPDRVEIMGRPPHLRHHRVHDDNRQSLHHAGRLRRQNVPG